MLKNILSRRLIFVLLLLSSNSLFAFSITRTSTGAGGAWGNSATWVPFGKPAFGDDIVIAAGSPVTITQPMYTSVNSVTINSGAFLTVSSILSCRFSTLDNSGTLDGSAKIDFNPSTPPMIIKGNGTYSNSGTWTFIHNTTIESDVVINKLGIIAVKDGIVTTNKGSVTLIDNTVSMGNTTSKWVNDVNSLLSVNTAFAGTGILDASANNNTVIYESSFDVVVKTPESDTYYNLEVRGGGNKTFSGNLVLKGGITTADNTVLQGTANSLSFTGGSAQTILGDGSVVCKGITVNNGSGGLTSNVDITNAGDITLTGGYLTCNGVLTMNGTSAQSISGTGNNLICNNTFVLNNSSGLSSSNYVLFLKDLTLTAGLYTNYYTIGFVGTSGAQTIGGTSGQMHCAHAATIQLSNADGVTTTRPITIDGEIAVNLGTFSTGTTPITLASAAGVTGVLGYCEGTVAGTNWVMQRYIAASDTGWQDMASPRSGDDISTWDASLYLSMSNACPDGTADGWQSVYSYNPSIQDFVAVTDCNESLSPGKGLEFWLATSLTSFDGATITSAGTPNQGTYNVTIGSNAGDIALIGNPYQCPIDWGVMMFDNETVVTNGFMIYDETIYNYAVWDGDNLTGTGKLASSDGYIPPWQGFWVTNTTASSDFLFNEYDKASSDNEIFLLPKKQPDEKDLLKIKIHSASMPNAGESIIKFTPQSLDAYDTKGDFKFMPAKERRSPNIYVLSADDKKLTLASYPYDSPSKDIILVATVSVAGDYLLDIKNVNLLSAYKYVSLQDMETGHTEVLKGDYTYRFKQEKVNKEHKFVLHFGKTLTDINSYSPGSTNVNVVADAVGVNAYFNFDKPTVTEIRVSNMLGDEVLRKTVNVAEETVPLAIPQGNNIYLIQFSTSEGIVTKKIFY